MHKTNLQNILQKTSCQRFDLKIDFDENNYLPISIFKGKKEGKNICIIAGIHGYEYPPIMAIQKLLKEIKLENLTGNLIFIPIANLGSFQKRIIRNHPEDNKNLNYIFPGTENGTITERIANYITKEIIPISDIFIDLHGGDANEDLTPFACYYENTDNQHNTNIARELSIISNLPFVVSYPYTINKTEPALYAFKQAIQNEKIALSLEVGKLGSDNIKDTEIMTNAIFNILDFCKVYPNPNQIKIENQQIFLSEQFYIRVPQKGIFYSQYKAGDWVKKEENLGYITDEFGTFLEQITAPEDGIILYKISTPPVNKNETMFCIAR